MNKIRVILVITILITSSYCAGSETVKNLAPDAEKIVLNGMESPDARIRANAIEVVASGQKIEIMPKVVELLNDADMPVRFAAAVAIGDMRYKAGEKKLVQMLKDSDLNVVIAAAYALCKLGNQEYLAMIESAAGTDDQTVKANAAMLLGKLKSKSSLPLLYKLKDDPDASDIVAFNAVEAIARIGDDKIYSKIWTMLISVYADDRYIGVQAMGALGGVKGANAIITLLDDDVVEVRLAAAEELGMLGEASGQIVVLEYLNSPEAAEKETVERRNTLAALAIGQIGTESLTAHLPKLLKNDSPFVRLAAAKSVFILTKGR
ncbi:MAG: HEAT repeat domain-containing protein [Planctomycetes bacterium]|nr:HEAT repeat domain-containing protein [Planctomycetota bacterium]